MLGGFAVVALQENRPEVADFADKMRLHAQTEEEVLYPAAILVGRYGRVFRASCPKSPGMPDR